MDSREQRAREIQEAIRQILLKDWDPIGVQDAPQAQDEYDGYVGGVYHLLLGSPSQQEIIDHLRQIETGWMGLSAPKDQRLSSVAAKLAALDVRL